MIDNGDAKTSEGFTNCGPLSVESLNNQQSCLKRELSPVLTNSNKRPFYNRKKPKSRIELVKRFKDTEKLDKKIFSVDYESKLNGDNATDRLIKLKELDVVKKKCLSNFYVPKLVAKKQILSTCEGEELKYRHHKDNNVNNHKYYTEDSIPVGRKDGFCTGSGQSVTVSSEDLIKHSQLFRGIYEANDVVQGCDNKYLHIPKLNQCKDVSFLQTSITDTQLLLAVDDALSSLNDISRNNIIDNVNDSKLENDFQSETNSYFNGFQPNEQAFALNLLCSYTDFAKSVENEIEIKTNLLSSINQFNDLTDSTLTASIDRNIVMTKDNKVTSDTLIEHSYNMDFINNLNPLDLISDSNNQYGFQTASRKPIEISSAALKKAQDVFKNLTETENKENEIVISGNLFGNSINRIDKRSIITYSEDNLHTDKAKENTFDDNDNELKSSLGKTSFFDCEFQTASKKPIKILSTAIKRAQNILNDIYESDFNETLNRKPTSKIKESNSLMICGSQTALKMPIETSLIVSSQAENTFNEIIDCNKPIVCDVSEKLVEIPSAANDILNQACKSDFIRFDDSELKNVMACEFQTGSKKPIVLSASATKMAQNIFNRICESNSNEMQNAAFTDEMKNCDLSTAGDYQSFSEKPLKNSSTTVPKTIQTMSNKNCEIQTGEFINEINDYDSPVVSGFQTASKKSIKMSSTAFEKAETMFNKILESDSNEIHDSDFTNKLKNYNPSSIDEFQAPLKKSLKTTSGVIKGPQAIFNQTCDSDSNEVQNPGFTNEIENYTSSVSCGFQTASKKPIKMSSAAVKKAQTIFDQICEPNEIQNRDFTNKMHNNYNPPIASEKPIETSSTSFNKSQTMFNQLSEIDSNQIQNANLSGIKHRNSLMGCGFETASKKPIELSSAALLKAQNIFNQICDDDNFPEKSSFSVTSEKDIAVSEKSCVRTKRLLSEEDTINNDCKKPRIGFGNERDNYSSKLEVSKNGTNQNNDLSIDEELFANVNLDESTISLKQHSPGLSGINKPTKVNRVLSQSGKKRRLGISGCRPVSISNEKLARAKLIFSDLDKPKNIQDGSYVKNLQVKLNDQPQIHTSTPLKPTILRQTPVKCHQEKNSLVDVNITPVKHLDYKDVSKNVDKDEIVSIHEITKGNTEEWETCIDKEFEELQVRMKILLERKVALQKQKQLMDQANHEYRRPRTGFLLTRKQASSKISLRNLINNHIQTTATANDRVNAEIYKTIFDITPANALSVHFNCKNDSFINTLDGAIIIPNSDNFVGLSEIKAAFEVAPGIDLTLLPNGWISNHFKWIVWKLASLERRFPQIFSGCFSLENVMQQLKYRYDREIDRAERPCLRKILEKDDVPQKRMVLCVSNIIKFPDHTFELELTDGWYAIRTVIDPALCKQIFTSKIKIGTKLVIQSAEILNCDGCHPLDVPDHVKLKITCNCTRRARWYARLGYQRIVEPFPMRLKTVYSDGGMVACINVKIVRVYPLTYMEKYEGRTVWRNKRAEEKLAQEWSSKKLKSIEMIQQQVQNDYEKEILLEKEKLTVDNCKYNVKDVRSPQLLWEMIENTDDPDGIKDILSTSQVSAAVQYQTNISNNRQQELTRRIAKEIKKLKCTQRDVVPVLRLRVVDIMESTDDSCFITIWKPTEDHLQLLKEESIFYIYNVIPKKKDFTTTTRTHFKQESNEFGKSSSTQRWLMSIQELLETNKCLFNEFDTVGTVVQINKKSNYQQLWIADVNRGSLLLIKIFGVAEYCCLLESLNRGENVAIMNLIYSRSQATIVEAIANQYTVITCYPQHKFLQQGLATYCEQLPKELHPLLNECDKKIDLYVSNREFANSCKSSSFGKSSLNDVFDDSSEENTLMQSRLTTTDVAMSLIDMDQFR